MGAAGGAEVALQGLGPERGRDGPEAPSNMLAQHGSSLPGHSIRRKKSKETNLPVDLSGHIWIVFFMAVCSDDGGI